MRKLIGILSLAFLPGCGTVGAPQPPSLHLPEPVRDLRASRKGDKVTLTGFGSFQVRKTAARTGFNPRTRQKIKIAAGQRAAFSAGSTLN